MASGTVTVGPKDNRQLIHYEHYTDLDVPEELADLGAHILQVSLDGANWTRVIAPASQANPDGCGPGCRFGTNDLGQLCSNCALPAAEKLFTEGGHPKLKSRQIPDPEKSKRKADGSWGKIIQMDYHVLDLRAPAVQKRSQEAANKGDKDKGKGDK